MNKQDMIQQSLDGKNDVRIAKSRRHSVPLQLTGRDLELLSAIYEAGGVLTTVQLALMFWPPDINRRLAHFGVSEADELLSQYGTTTTNQHLELWKWLGKVNRIKGQTVAKADMKLADFLADLKKANVVEFHQLEALCSQAAHLSASQFLQMSLAQYVELPAAFLRRPQFPSDFVSSACKSRLKSLSVFGVIESSEQPTKLSEGRAQSCWFLTKRGRNLLAEMRHVRASELDWKPVGAYGTLHLGHRLLLNDFRIAVELACRMKGYTLRRWIDDNQLKRLLGNEKVELVRLVRDPETHLRQEQTESYALKIPDGYFWIDLGDGKVCHCFVELDNQTLTISDNRDSAKDYAQKIRTISAFYRSGRYKEVFAEADGYMWYLTVTTGSARRVQNLRQTAEKVIGPHNKAVDRYWYTTMDKILTWEDYFAASVFTPIWERAGQDRKWALDDPFEVNE